MKFGGLGFQGEFILVCLGMTHVHYRVEGTGQPSDFRRWRRSAVGCTKLALSSSVSLSGKVRAA